MLRGLVIPGGAAAAPVGGNINISAGTTSNALSALTFSNSNGVSFGLDASTITATVRTDYQSAGAYLTTAMASNRGSDFVQATAAFAGTSASGTIASNGISVSIGPYITTAALSNHSHGASGQNGSFAFQTLSFSNANGISFGTSAGSAITASHNALTTAMASNRGSDFVAATAGFAGTNASGTIASNGISVSVAAPGAGGGNAIAAGTRTAGAGSTVLFSNLNGLTFGLDAVNGSVMTASHNALTTAMASNRGSDFVQATAAFAGTNASGTIASGGISVSVAAPGGGAAVTETMWYPYNEAVNVVGAVGNGSLIVNPLPANARKEFDRIGMVFTFTNASNSTGSMSLSLYMAFYTQNASTLSLLHSQSTNQTIQYAGNNSSASNRGIRIVTMPWTTTITEAFYYVGMMSKTATAGANASISQMLVSALNSGLSGMMQAATNRSVQWPLGLGIMSASTAALPASVAFSNLDGTGTSVARVPTWFAQNGTV